MPRGSIAGATDYSHQTLHDILNDLNDWKLSLISTTDYIKATIKQLVDNGYWSTVPYEMASLVAYTLKFYETSIAEIDDIIQGLKVEVQQHHISRLRSLGKTAYDLNIDFGRVWHQEYKLKDYGNPDFSNVERIYSHGRDMVIDMLDLDNAAARLEAFLGMKSGKDAQQASKKYAIPILSMILGIIIAIVSNVASNIWPPVIQPYLWLSWPLLAILIGISIAFLLSNE